CGKISWTCNWRVNFASRSPFEANWSFADFEPRLNNLAGLYFLGLYQGSGCAAGASFGWSMGSCAEPGKEPRKKQSITTERTIEERRMLTSPRAGRAIQFIPKTRAYDDKRMASVPLAVCAKHAKCLAVGLSNVGVLIAA